MKLLEYFPGTKGGNLSGIVNRSEWDELALMNATTSPVNEYSVKDAHSMWKGIQEDDKHIVLKERVNQLMQQLRSKLILKSNRSNEEYTLRNIFRSFDMDSNGVLSVSEIRGLTSALGVKASDSELNALFLRLDKN